MIIRSPFGGLFYLTLIIFYDSVQAMETKKRGGPRPNAGRPRLPQGQAKTFIPLYLESALVELIRSKKPENKTYTQYIQSLLE